MATDTERMREAVEDLTNTIDEIEALQPWAMPPTPRRVKKMGDLEMSTIRLDLVQAALFRADPPAFLQHSAR